MKEKIKMILKSRLLIVLITIVLMFGLTIYWRYEATKTWGDYAEKNEIYEKKWPVEKLSFLTNKQDAHWNQTHKKIWTYDFLILTSGIFLFIALGKDNNYEKK